MSDDEMEKDVDDLINQAVQEEKKKEEKKANIRDSNIKENNSTHNLSKEEEINVISKKNTVLNKRKQSIDSNSSSDSDSQDSSPQENYIDNNKKNIKTTSMVSTDSSLENLMVTRDLNIKLFTLISCIFCIGTSTLTIIGSLIFERLLTFNYGQKKGTDKVIEEITMNKTMIYIIFALISCFNIGLLIMISLNNDHNLTKLIYGELNWFFVLTQFSFGSIFLITLIWDTDLWTINVCLSISMLTILILAFYFTEIKQKKNMSNGTLIFIYIYISFLFSFISYITLYNISCIIMENMGVQKHNIKNTVSKIIKVGVNAGQTILSFVLLTYLKDIFFAFTSGYIECAVFIHEDTDLKGENIAIFVMVLTILLGIILTIYRYGKKTFGYEEVKLEMLKEL